MPLPKIDVPTFQITIPSTKKEMTFRPFLVKEEKILLMAKEAGTTAEILKAIKQIIVNCCQQKINVDKLLIVDLEYCFLQLRAHSIENKIKLTYIDSDDSKEYSFEINLFDIGTSSEKKISNKIKITPKSGIVMKHPDVSIIDKIEKIESEVELITFYINNCIESIYDEDTVYDPKEYSDEELAEFVDSLSIKTFEKIKEFIESAPKIEHQLRYTNSLGVEKTINLNSLQDFFTLA